MLVSLGWTARDYVKRVWDNSGEDNVFFLAGGIAFNLLLAAVPFLLLIVSGAAFFLGESTGSSSALVTGLLDALMPPHAGTMREVLRKLIEDVVKARTSLGIWSLVGFIWFSTRLFGSLRSVLAEVFDIEFERGIIGGKIFDIQITVLASVFISAYAAISTYLAVATTRGVAFLERAGIRKDAMGSLEYWMGRVVAFWVIAAMFFSLYKFLPIRRVRTSTAWIAALFTGICFELAKNAFTAYISRFSPGSLYSGTIAALVIAVVWVYYAALIFILGGEVGQVYELRRTRRRQRAVLFDR